MAQLVVRKIDESVKRALHERARRKGHSMEAEVRDILRQAVGLQNVPNQGLGSAISARFCDIGFDDPIEEHHGATAMPAELEG